MKIEERIEEALGAPVVRLKPLSGGCVAEVYRADLAGGRCVVAKVDDGPGALDVEGRMLNYLGDRTELPVPKVMWSAPNLLVIEYIDNDGRGGPQVAIDAADALAALHDIGHPTHGFKEPTLIGGLLQPNPPTASWVEFFAEHRLLEMGRRCVDAGQLVGADLARLERLCAGLDRYLEADRPASLLHGDIWGGNILVHKGRLAAFIDPAIYYGDAEVELAFIGLFRTFGQRFYDRYQEHRPIAPGFFEVRRDLYNLYPLLVHVRLFGGGYVGQFRSILGGLI